MPDRTDTTGGELQRSDVQRERARGLRLAGLEDGGKRKPPSRPRRAERDTSAVEQPEPQDPPAAVEPAHAPAEAAGPPEPVAQVPPVEHVEHVEVIEVVSAEPEAAPPEPESQPARPEPVEAEAPEPEQVEREAVERPTSQPEPAAPFAGHRPGSPEEREPLPVDEDGAEPVDAQVPNGGEPAAAPRAAARRPHARTMPQRAFDVPRVARPRAPSFAPALGFLAALRSALARGLDLPAAVEAAATALPGSARGAARRAAARLRGDYAQDAWGYDDEFVEIVYPLFEFMYERWWRVRSTGVSNVPAHGAAMLVANHAGVLPWDATMMSVAIFKEHPLPRQPRFMVLDWAFRLPWVSGFMRRVGGVVASPYNAQRLLEQGHLVMVFPEGSKGAGKPFSERYRLQRFGRGGFVEIALRTGAPIVPVAVVGSEEIYPKIGESRLAARLLGAPYFPITPTFPALGVLGTVPLPSKWRIEFCEPIDLGGYGPEAAEDRTVVFELSEQVRGTIQQRLLENLVRRGSAFF